MNTIQTVQVDYINYASRTLETIILTNEEMSQKVVYLYNHDGQSFRIFENLLEVANYLHNQPYKVLKEYAQERFVDTFLAKYPYP